jgi:uncharacterized coiled-coil DUF342 family protein
MKLTELYKELKQQANEIDKLSEKDAEELIERLKDTYDKLTKELFAINEETNKLITNYSKINKEIQELRNKENEQLNRLIRTLNDYDSVLESIKIEIKELKEVNKTALRAKQHPIRIATYVLQFVIFLLITIVLYVNISFKINGTIPAFLEIFFLG